MGFENKILYFPLYFSPAHSFPMFRHIGSQRNETLIQVVITGHHHQRQQELSKVSKHIVPAALLMIARPHYRSNRKKGAQNMQPSVFSQSFILRDPAYCSHTHGQKNHFHMQTVQSVTQCCQTARCQRKYHE